MDIEAFGLSDVGCRRDKNEDSFLINNDYQLFVVADGMGGHLGGEFASKLAVMTVEEVIKEIMQDSEMTFQPACDLKPGDYRGYLKYAISTASSRIFERAAQDQSLHGMGTTIVVALFRDGKLYCANVGDSRCYLIRSGKLKQLTVDHSLVGEQLRAGVLRPEEIRNHKLKNIITRSVGFQEDVDVDVTVKEARAGDRVVICSDGLTNMVTNDDILAIAGTRSIRSACNELIELANRNGGDDNITVVIAEVAATEDAVFRDEETQAV